MQREIEKKYLLKDQAARDAFVSQLKDRFPGFTHNGTKTVISYFYERANKEQVLAAGQELLQGKELADFTKLVKQMSDISVRCRSINETNYFVVKGAAEGEDAVHTANRLEFEAVMTQDLEEINAVITGAGIVLASKWSSKRDFYELDNGVNANAEFVSGYGYKAELEVITQDEGAAEQAQRDIDHIAEKLDLFYATDTLMGRMYDYYNQHWQEYFNTQDTFSDQVWQQLGRY